GHDGTLVGGPLWTTGKLGQGLSFDGVDDRVDVAHAADLDTYPLSVAAWFKTSSSSGVRGIVGKYVAGSYNGYNLFLNDGSLCAWYLRDDSNYVYDGSGCPFRLTGYNDGQWHHAVYVVDASGARLYVDGAEKGSLGWTGVAGAVSTTEPVHVGCYPGAFGGAEYFEGAADDVRIYPGALTASDVADLYELTVRYVDNLGACAGLVPCHPTIMDAVNAAASIDTIEVFPGVYHEAVTLPRLSSLVLRAHQPGLKPVIVAPPGGGSAITTDTGQGVQIINFVLEAPEGAGVWATSGLHKALVIEGNLIKGLRGIDASGYGCTVRNNTLLGGSISFPTGTSGCSIEANRTSGGGIAIGGWRSAFDNVIRDNVLQGGGITINEETVSRNTVQSNLVSGGSIAVANVHRGESNVIEDNVVRAGGITLNGIFTDTTIESNFVSGSAGDGIVVGVSQGGVLIRKNTSIENGGCDLNDTSNPSNSHNLWEENRFGTKCGAVP
ncbi:MAG: hypothetical protein DMF79_17750, partial [Acidobacteria bacterium]